MRILITEIHYNYVHGGGEYYAARLAEQLVAQGHSVEFLTGRSPGMKPSPVSTQFPIHNVPFFYPLRIWGERRSGLPGLFLRVLHYIIYVLGAWFFLVWRGRQYDVINAHDAISFQAAVWAKRLTKSCIAVTFHGQPGGLEKRLVKQADVVISVNEPYAEELRQLGVPTVAVIPTGIDQSLFCPGDREAARKRLGIGKQEHVYLFVGRFTPIKNLQRLIEAFSTVSKVDAAARLWLVGDGVLEGELRAAVEKHGLNKLVRFLGHQAAPQVAELYQAVDVFVLPSLSEAFSMVTLEALASGAKLCIGTTSHGIRAAIPDQWYELLEPEDVASIAAAMQRALARKARPQEQAAVTAAYSWESRASLTAEAFSTCQSR
jgi:glycosyltransferase involved in cell wall biosynthesis